jgi:FtsZ-binding cell division protein ZapB
MTTIIICQMNITEKLNELKEEYSKMEKVKDDAHARMKELRTQIGKLQTIAKHAQELFAEPKPETV